MLFDVNVVLVEIVYNTEENDGSQYSHILLFVLTQKEIKSNLFHG